MIEDSEDLHSSNSFDRFTHFSQSSSIPSSGGGVLTACGSVEDSMGQQEI